MAYSRRTVDSIFLARVGALIVVCTAVLTLSFFGLMAFVSGETAGLEKRVPLYVLTMALAFVASVVVLEQQRYEGVMILAVSGAIAIGSFVVLVLGGEGLIFAIRNPERAVASRRFLYVIAAGLIATGIGYWGLRHWRDVTGSLR